MRRASLVIVSAAVLVLAAACGGAPATPGPSGTIAPGEPTAASPTAPAGPVGGTCASVPTFAPGVVPSFAPDAELAALFPEQVDGVPVTDLNSLRMVDYLCALGGGQVAVDRFASNLPQGLDFTTFSHAYADLVVEGEEVDLAAYRAPGQDAKLIVQSFSQFVRALGGPDTAVAGITEATIGGKSVSVVTDENGAVGYLYTSGDVLFIISDVTDSQAAKILAALP